MDGHDGRRYLMEMNNRRTGDWMDGRMDGWIDGQMDGKADGSVDGRKKGWMNEWLDGWIVTTIAIVIRSTNESSQPRRRMSSSKVRHKPHELLSDSETGRWRLEKYDAVLPSLGHNRVFVYVSARCAWHFCTCARVYIWHRPSKIVFGAYRDLTSLANCLGDVSSSIPSIHFFPSQFT